MSISSSAIMLLNVSLVYCCILLLYTFFFFFVKVRYLKDACTYDTISILFRGIRIGGERSACPRKNILLCKIFYLVGWWSQKIFTNFSRKSAEGMQCCFSLVYTSFPTSCYVQACPFDPAYSGSVCREADQKCNKVFANVLARMPVEILRSLCQASNSVFPLRVSTILYLLTITCPTRFLNIHQEFRDSREPCFKYSLPFDIFNMRDILTKNFRKYADT